MKFTFLTLFLVVSSSFGANPALTYDSVTRITSPADADLRGDTLTLTGAMTLPDGVRQTFNPGATTPGLNWGSIAGDPSAPSNGDSWYNTVDNAAKVRINGVNVSIGSGGGGVTGTIVNPSPGGSASGQVLVSTGVPGTNASPTSALSVTGTTVSIPGSVSFTGLTLAYSETTNVVWDLSAGTVAYLSVTGTTYLILSNAPSGQWSARLNKIEDGTGGHTFTVGNTYYASKYSGAVTPTWTTNASSWDVLTLLSHPTVATNVGITLTPDLR